MAHGAVVLAAAGANWVRETSRAHGSLPVHWTIYASIIEVKFDLRSFFRLSNCVSQTAKTPRPGTGRCRQEQRVGNQSCFRLTGKSSGGDRRSKARAAKAQAADAAPATEGRKSLEHNSG
jgi:hypothetical protein